MVAAELANCNGKCTLVERDPNNCGECGNVCPGGICKDSICDCPTSG